MSRNLTETDLAGSATKLRLAPLFKDFMMLKNWETGGDSLQINILKVGCYGHLKRPLEIGAWFSDSVVLH